MKNLSLLICLVAAVAATRAQSQTRAGQVVELTYEYTNLGLGERRQVKLLFRGQESLSVFASRDTIPGRASRDFDLSGEDNQGRQVYKNTATGEIIFRDFVPDQNTFSACIVADPSARMKWTYSTEVKLIGKYTCKGAVTEFRGRRYVAWYTVDIPVSHGPWKFSGLPGAIVEVHSTDHNIVFALHTVKTLPHAEINHPVNGQAMTMVEYVYKREKALTDFVNSLSAKLPRGAQITATTTGDHNLEVDFSDVKK